MNNFTFKVDTNCGNSYSKLIEDERFTGNVLIDENGEQSYELLTNDFSTIVELEDYLCNNEFVYLNVEIA